MRILALLAVLTFSLMAPIGAHIDVEAERLLNSFEPFYKKIKSLSANAEWNHQTNLTDENQELLTKAQMKEEEMSQTYCTVVGSLVTNASSDINNATIRRLVQLISMACDKGNDTAARNEEFSRTVSTMTDQHSKAVVVIDGEPLPLDDLNKIMATSTDFNKLLQVWKGWHDNSTKEMKKYYERYVELYNKKANDMGLANAAELWQQSYEHRPPQDFQSDLDKLWITVKPLYQQLHGYIRFMLMNTIYKNFTNFFPDSKHIPIHVLGHMHAQVWSSLYSKVAPHPEIPSLEVTDEMLKQNYTVQKMFELSDDFFKSLGLDPMPRKFWEKSIITKPKDRNIVCHASAWTFYDDDDVRIKMCTTITHRDLEVVHHEMSHIQYFLEYRRHPVQFQESANPGFHEAIGDTVSLAVTTPKHLRTLKLLKAADNATEEKVHLNFLMLTALQKIAFLPSGYLYDLWRWKVFNGTIKPENYNDEWWRLICKYQGVYSPVVRNASGFDPGAKYHIPANSKYISYFISYILQFQFYQTMCELSNHPKNESLFNCDFYNSTEAGAKFKQMMAYGTSKHWSEVLNEFAGTNSYNATAILAYFKPLHDWLIKFNTQHNVSTGWDEDKCPPPPSMPSTAPPTSDPTVEIPTTAPPTEEVPTTVPPTEEVPTTAPPTEEVPTTAPPTDEVSTTTDDAPTTT